MPGRSQIAQEGSNFASWPLLLFPQLAVHPRSLACWLMDVGRCILCFRVNAFLEVCPFPKGRGEAAVGKGHLRPYLHQSPAATAIRINFCPQNNGTSFEQLERRQSYQLQTKVRDSSIPGELFRERLAAAEEMDLIARSRAHRRCDMASEPARHLNGGAKREHECGTGKGRRCGEQAWSGDNSH